MHHLISRINFLSHSVSLAQITLLMMSHSLIHLTPTHHSPPTSRIHYFIPGSKLTFSLIFSTIDCWHPPGLPSWTILDRTYSAQRFFVFSYCYLFIFYFVSCGRLSWFKCQLSLLTYLLVWFWTDRPVMPQNVFFLHNARPGERPLWSFTFLETLVCREQKSCNRDVLCIENRS